MASYQPSPNFENAAAFLSSASSLSRVSNTVKLELYGLFKYLTSSRSPTSSRPSIFDMTGRAKWDAWDAAGKKYERGEAAEQKYLEIARSLGWSGTAVVQRTPEAAKGDTQPAGSSSEDIWDAPGTSSSGPGGMGLSVSTMAQPPQTFESTVHGLALSNDVSGLKFLLDASENADLNTLDEYASPLLFLEMFPTADVLLQGYAPIHLACDRGNIEVVKLLLSRGADRNVKDPDGLTPLELSNEAGNTEIANLLNSTP